jgi:integrase
MKRKGGLPAPIVLRRGRLTFRDIANDALAYADEHKRSAQHDRWRMKKLLEWFGSKRADSIRAKEIEDRFKEQNWAPATWNRHRALLSLTFRLAIRAEKLTENPARLVPHKTEHNERVRFLSPEEKRLRVVIRAHYPEQLPEFDLALHTGLRLSEHYGAQWDRVNWEQRVLTIPQDKGGKTSHVPLNDAALAALKTLRRRTSATGFVCGAGGRPRRWFDECVKAAGVEAFSWHCLRHTFASRLVMSGTDIRTVAELLRHRTLAMAMRYSHLAPDFRMAAVQRMQQTFSAPPRESRVRKSGTRSGTRTSRRRAAIRR